MTVVKHSARLQGTRSGKRLRVALEPVLPDRAAEAVSTDIRYGYDLRLRGGERLSSSHPLLEVFGAKVGLVEPGARRSGAFQHSAFNPGREVLLVAEPDYDGALAVGIWDLDRERRAGRLEHASATLVLAGERYGIEYHGVVLDEIRTSGTEVRTRLRIFVFAATSVALALGRLRPYIRPADERKKLLLVIEDDGAANWWDGDGCLGPAGLDHLPVSLAVHQAHDELVRAARKLRRQRDSDGRARAALDKHRRTQERFELRAQEFWLLAHRELATTYLIGYVAPNMQEPVWTLEQLTQDYNEGESYVAEY
jgi:hypothetical protein